MPEKMNPLNRVSNQVIAFAVSSHEGPMKSWDIRKVFYGEAYLSGPSKANNAAYNRSKNIAIEEEVIVKEGDVFVLGPVGQQIIDQAKENNIDLSSIMTKARADYEAKISV